MLMCGQFLGFRSGFPRLLKNHKYFPLVAEKGGLQEVTSQGDLTTSP